MTDQENYERKMEGRHRRSRLRVEEGRRDRIRMRWRKEEVDRE